MVSTEFDKRLEANIRESLRFAVGQVDEEAVAHMVAGVNAVLNHPSAPAPSSHLEGGRYVHVGFQWRGRAEPTGLWSPWRDGPCPALAPKGSETEERRVYALITEGSDNG